MSIPASYFVKISPGVIGAGGQAIDLNALMLTTSTRVPIGTVLTLNSYAAVLAYFGAGAEANGANVYFQGPDNSLSKPGAMLFYQVPYSTAVRAYLRGGSGLTLAQVQAITSGTLTITTNGTPLTSSALNLSSATTFSLAATAIQAAFTAPPFTVTYDSLAGAFLFTETGGSAGTTTMAFATGANAAPLLLTLATGAVLSQGSPTVAVADALNAVVALTTNWATYLTTFEPITADKITAAQWLTTYLNRYVYIMWDTDVTVQSTVPATTSAGYAIAQADISGVIPLSDTLNGFLNACAIAGWAASLNFSATNGRTTLEYTSESGLIPGVTGGQVASNCNANGYVFYGNANAGNTALNFFGFVHQANSDANVIGSCSGPFGWADSYVNQIHMNNDFQATLLTFFTTIRSVPYNVAGFTMLRQALSTPIQSALNFGTIRSGISLSGSQIADVVALTGVAGAPAAITTNGWYLFIGDPGASVRQIRGSPVMIFLYTDGQSVNSINLGSLEVA